MDDIRLEQLRRDDWAISAGADWTDARSIYDHLTLHSNFTEAAKSFPWARVIRAGARILDLGCGAGWLTAMLTSRSDVSTVIAWDASEPLLQRTLPEMLTIAGGDPTKVRAVVGMFTPLLLDDRSIDLIVMSSAFHHVDEPGRLLDDCRRVLDDAGFLVLLNEVPYARLSMIRFIATTALAASVNSLTNRFALTKRGHVAAGHILYDDVLGDRAMTMPQWRRLFMQHRFKIEVIDAGLPSHKPDYRRKSWLQSNLVHFLASPERSV
jgi:ubiquinone/menaquinone biosynthesis C-methylase UbiE